MTQDYTPKNHQLVVAILLKTGLKNTYYAAHIINSCQQYCSALLHLIRTQQYCFILLTTVNNVGSTTLFNLVVRQAQSFSRVKVCMIIEVYTDSVADTWCPFKI